LLKTRKLFPNNAGFFSSEPPFLQKNGMENPREQEQAQADLP
jgi:hypothetical protein